jgi:hypothetical protein
MQSHVDLFVEKVRSTPAALLTDGFRSKWGDITDTSVAVLGKTWS